MAVLYSESMFMRNEPMRKLEAVILLGYRRAAILYYEPIFTKHRLILLGGYLSMRYRKMTNRYSEPMFMKNGPINKLGKVMSKG